MNRVAILLLAAVLVIAVCAIVAFAQTGVSGPTVVTSEEAGLQPLEEDIGMRGPRMGPMAGRAAIAVSGNNVFVIAGGLLLKYDQNLNLPQGAGIQAAQHLVNNEVEGVITGHCGPKAFRVLSAAGIAVYNCDAQTVSEAIEQFKSGVLKPAESADVEGHWV